MEELCVDYILYIDVVTNARQTIVFDIIIRFNIIDGMCYRYVRMLGSFFY